ncbi:MAG: hypothetical protein WC755_07950 [Candidatus Woesearchaeota archaeon]|jgi:hypothetical protein
MSKYTGDIKMMIKNASNSFTGPGRLILASQNTKPTGGYIKPTAQYSKKFGGIVTSEGTFFKTRDKSYRPSGYDWLGEQKGMAVKGMGGQKVVASDIPKPFKFASFSDYFAKDLDKSNYNIIKNAAGITTQITAKPQDYAENWRRERKGSQTVHSTFVPYEAQFTDEGKLLKEINRAVYTDYEREGVSTKKPYETEIKMYKDGNLSMVEKFGLDIKEYGDRNKVTRSPVKTNVLDYEAGMETILPTRRTEVGRTQIIATPINPNKPIYSLGGKTYQYSDSGTKVEVDTKTGKITGNIIQEGNMINTRPLSNTIYSSVINGQGVAYKYGTTNKLIEVDPKTGKPTGRIWG